MKSNAAWENNDVKQIIPYRNAVANCTEKKNLIFKIQAVVMAALKLSVLLVTISTTEKVLGATRPFKTAFESS